MDVPVLCLGTMTFGTPVGEREGIEIVRRALELGIRFIDTANMYEGYTRYIGSVGGAAEEILGRALKGSRRDDAVVATKVGMKIGPGAEDEGLSRDHIQRECDRSLQRLATDRIDLYYMHRWDPDTPIEETMRALDDLVHSGKVRYLGCSNYTAWQMVEAIWTAKDQNLYNYCCVQPEYSLVVRDVEKELVPATKRYGMSLIPFFPLASGFLTGKYTQGEEPPEGTRFAGSPNMGNRYFNDDNWALLGKLQSFAGERGHSVAELAFSWLLGNPVVPSVIAGATKPEQVTANAQAAGWQLSDEEMAEIREML